jgi:hypothetical protein
MRFTWCPLIVIIAFGALTFIRVGDVRAAQLAAVNDAANFKAADGKPWAVNNAWYGASCFDTHGHLWCEGTKAGLECRDSP